MERGKRRTSVAGEGLFEEVSVRRSLKSKNNLGVQKAEKRTFWTG